ncbi:hypothetical protein DIPPA_25917 [Diplonema papillatum]|nr:hypothetical protein DIPPA_25917 [Diplonema papillatum]
MLADASLTICVVALTVTAILLSDGVFSGKACTSSSVNATTVVQAGVFELRSGVYVDWPYHDADGCSIPDDDGAAQATLLPTRWTAAAAAELQLTHGKLQALQGFSVAGLCAVAAGDLVFLCLPALRDGCRWLRPAAKLAGAAALLAAGLAGASLQGEVAASGAIAASWPGVGVPLLFWAAGTAAFAGGWALVWRRPLVVKAWGGLTQALGKSRASRWVAAAGCNLPRVVVVPLSVFAWCLICSSAVAAGRFDGRSLRVALTLGASVPMLLWIRGCCVLCLFLGALSFCVAVCNAGWMHRPFIVLFWACDIATALTSSIACALFASVDSSVVTAAALDIRTELHAVLFFACLKCVVGFFLLYSVRCCRNRQPGSVFDAPDGAEHPAASSYQPLADSDELPPVEGVVCDVVVGQVVHQPLVYNAPLGDQSNDGFR